MDISNNQKLISMYQFINDLNNKEYDYNKYDINYLKYRFSMCLEYCSTNDIIISNQLVYFWLRLNKDDIYDIEHGRRNAPSDVADFIKYVKSYCAMNRENLALDGTINPVLAIFHQKAYDGLKDTPDVHVLPIAVPQALNQTDILKQFGMQALEGKKEKDF